MKLLFATLGLSMLMACAQGEATGPGDNNGGPDARVFPDAARFPDANTNFPDARVFPDANITPIPDGGILPTGDAGTGLFCNTDNDCTTAGECCFTLGQPPGFCVPGDNSLGVCIPN